jgi:hypothetical protein
MTATGVIGFDRIRQLKTFRSAASGITNGRSSFSSWLHDRHADGVGGALFAFRASGHVIPL